MKPQNVPPPGTIKGKINKRVIAATSIPAFDIGAIAAIIGEKASQTENNIQDIYFQQFLNLFPVAVYTCNKKGYLKHFNEAAVELFGRIPQPGIDLWCGSWKAYTMEGKQYNQEEYPMAIAQKQGETMYGQQIQIERPDGTRRTVLPYLQPIANESGEIVGGVNVVIDITGKLTGSGNVIDVPERKIFEEKIAHLAAIVQFSDDAIVSKTLNGIVTSWNNAAERIFGYTPIEMIGQPINKIIPIDRWEEEPRILERLKRGERIDHFETKRITKDKKLIDVSLTISPIKNSQGHIIGASKIARDITAQKRAEQLLRESEERLRQTTETAEKMVLERTRELRKMNELLEKSNHELEQFAYIASHDLQEPLRKIQTFVELVKDNFHDPALTEKYFSKINSSAQRMSMLITDVLNYSRLTQTREQFVDADLNKILKNVLSDFELLIEQKQAVITNNDLPVIKGVPLQLNQLFSNLLSNSLKFAENKPEINITAKILSPEEIKHNRRLKSNDEYVQLTFTDTGIGFEQQYAKQIFVIFQRLNNQKAYSGTGIGLALCKKIVEYHHGTISATSEKDKGATFTVILPVHQKNRV